MSLSLLAQLIADKAISHAKRSDCERAASLHLLAGIRSWNEEEFDHRFPQVGETLAEAIRRVKGTALKCLGLDDEAAERLSKVQSATDAWTLAADLVAETQPMRQQSPTPSYATEKTGLVEHPSSQPSPPREVAVSALPFGITEELAERVSVTLGQSVDATKREILTEAHAVCVITLGTDTDNLAEELKKASQMVDAEIDPATELSKLVERVATVDTNGAGRLATQLALALVEVAEWAAALDTNITSDETDRIDTIRMALRDQLGDRISAESASVSAFEEKFSRLVGMDSVKSEIRKRVDFLVVNKRREKRGLGAIPHRMHVAFVGNPGTGKTTVARLYGELLNDLGLLPTRNFVETDRSGLVAEFVGQTEKKTLEQIEKADGGVLFIDECYALNDGYRDQKGFGEEATDCLVKQMEDRRERLVVILAGYKERTLEYMKTNPGLQSRVPIVVDFPDYSVDELMNIADRIVSSRGLVIDDSAKPPLRMILEESKKTPEFGNARTVENILETAERNVVNRTSHLSNLATEKELRTILSEDLPRAAAKHTKQIGFSRASQD